jgi:hypothetical protein
MYTVGSTLATITNNDITIVGNSQATMIIQSSGGGGTRRRPRSLREDGW